MKYPAIKRRKKIQKLSQFYRTPANSNPNTGTRSQRRSTLKTRVSVGQGEEARLQLLGTHWCCNEGPSGQRTSTTALAAFAMKHQGCRQHAGRHACLVAKSRPTLYNPMDCSPPDSSVHGISQARILEWVAISFSRESFDPGVEPTSPALQADSLSLCHLRSLCHHHTYPLLFWLHFNYKSYPIN